jgi:protein-tyrosine phosphatase
MELIPGDSTSSNAFTLATVCTANVCRSPAMATVLSSGVGRYPGLVGSGVEVVSAGVNAVAGIPIDERTAKALSQAGYEPPATTSIPLERGLIASADLILTASRRHRATIVRMSPDARERTFTMREFARYCSLLAPDTVRGEDVPARLRSVLIQVRELRGFDLPQRPKDDDVTDPIDGSLRVHRKTVRTIVAAADAILAVVDDRAHGVTPEAPAPNSWEALRELGRTVAPR